MNVAPRIGIAAGIGAGAGIALGLIDEPAKTGPALSHVALGTSIGVLSAAAALRGGANASRLGATMLGAAFAGVGLAHLLRGGDQPVQRQFNPATDSVPTPTPTSVVPLPRPSREQQQAPSLPSPQPGPSPTPTPLD